MVDYEKNKIENQNQKKQNDSEQKLGSISYLADQVQDNPSFNQTRENDSISEAVREEQDDKKNITENDTYNGEEKYGQKELLDRINNLGSSSKKDLITASLPTILQDEKTDVLGIMLDYDENSGESLSEYLRTYSDTYEKRPGFNKEDEVYKDLWQCIREVGNLENGREVENERNAGDLNTKIIDREKKLSFTEESALSDLRYVLKDAEPDYVKELKARAYDVRYVARKMIKEKEKDDNHSKNMSESNLGYFSRTIAEQKARHETRYEKLKEKIEKYKREHELEEKTKILHKAFKGRPLDQLRDDMLIDLEERIEGICERCAEEPYHEEFCYGPKISIYDGPLQCIYFDDIADAVSDARLSREKYNEKLQKGQQILASNNEAK